MALASAAVLLQAAENPKPTAEGEIARVMAVKDAAIQEADTQYAEQIGSSYTLGAEVGGELELGMNEEKPEWHANNAGFLDVTLTIRKRPAPIPVSRPTPVHTASADPPPPGAP